MQNQGLVERESIAPAAIWDDERLTARLTTAISIYERCADVDRPH